MEMDRDEQLNWANHIYRRLSNVAEINLDVGVSGELVRKRLISRIFEQGHGEVLDDFATVVDTWNWSTSDGLEKAEDSYEDFKEKYQNDSASSLVKVS